MMRSIVRAGLMIVLLGAFAARADEPARPVPLDGQCPVAADEHWSPQEKFVWSRVCIGQVADFNATPGYGGELDPKRPEGLPDNRVLTSAFLDTILLADKYRSVLTRNGVRIVGARFTERVDLGYAELAHELWLDRCLLEQGADFVGVRSTSRITFYRTHAMGLLRFSGARIDGGISFSGSDLSDLSLYEAHIGGDVDLEQSQIHGSLDLTSVQVAGDLNMGKSQFGDANLNMASVGGVLDLSDANSSGQLNMLSVTIVRHLLMNGGQFNDVLMADAHIQGQAVLMQTKVSGTLNMGAMRVDGNLVMNGQSQFGQVLLINAHLLTNLDLTFAAVHGLLDMTNLRIDGVLDMSGGNFSVIHLNHAYVGGLVGLVGSKVSGILSMGLTRIDGALTMNDKAEFSDINLANTQISGSLDLSGSKVHGTLNMFGVKLAGALYLNGNAEFDDIDLLDARIGELLNLRGSKVTGALDLESVEVHGDVFLSGGSEFTGPINLIFADIGELELSNSTFHNTVDITGAQILSDLVLGPLPAHWTGDAMLVLHNARANAIQDTHDAWPARLDLTGFTYRSLGGVHPDQADRMDDRQIKWFKGWLAKGQYSPLPYAQLAAVLREGGRPDAADDILYAGKQRERLEARWPQRIWLTALDWSVGYGYHVERALLWVVGFILAGVVVLRVSGEGRRHGMPYGVAYSFDLLLPIIRLRELHYSIELTGWARYYFYVHKIMGYVLASFLVVGVSGLVK